MKLQKKYIFTSAMLLYKLSHINDKGRKFHSCLLYGSKMSRSPNNIDPQFNKANKIQTKGLETYPLYSEKTLKTRTYRYLWVSNKISNIDWHGLDNTNNIVYTTACLVV